MTHTKSALFGLVISAIAAPAFAGGFAFDLPRLTFPEPTTPIVSQNCTSPVSLGVDACVEK